MPSIFLPQTPFMRYFTCFGYFSTYAVIAVCGGFTAILKRYFEGLGVTFKILKKVEEKFEESPELGASFQQLDYLPFSQICLSRGADRAFSFHANEF